MADSADPLRAALADRYRLDREIGQGATATVYLAEDLKHRRPVALKVLRPEITALLGPERFLAEIQVSARLTHPHVLPLYDSGTAAGRLYYVMPYVAGESLRDRIDREKQLPVGDALRVAREVAGALGYAHRQGLVHRDIKPENILLQEGHAVVSDFGIARALTVAGGPRLTQSGVMLGTPAYMSPEQATAGADLDARSDLYSLGCVLYEMLAGQTPFTAPTVEALVYQHLSVPPRDVTTMRPSVPAAVSAVVTRALAKTAADRFRDAAEMERAIENAAATGTTSVVPAPPPFPAPASPGPPPPRAEARSRAPLARLAIPAALGLLVLIAVLVVPRLRTRPTSSQPGAVAVLPFTVRGAADLQYLGEGMVDLLSTSLDGAAELRRVDPHALLGYLRRHGGDEPTPERGRDVAAHFDAPLFVLGDVMQVGGRTRLQASLYERDRIAGPIASATAEGDERELSSLVDQLAARLLSEYTGKRVELGGRLARIAAVTTSSLPALKAYLEGEQAFRRARYPEAVDAFHRAVELDSTFALGWYRYSGALGWTPGPQSLLGASDAAQRAVRYADRLTDHDRELLLSREALNAGRVEEAERHAQAIVQSHPDDAEAWVALGEALFHGNPFRGRSKLEAEAPFERALFLDPDALEPLDHLISIAVDQGRVARADSLLARLVAANGDVPEMLPLRAVVAVARRDSAAVERLLPAIAVSPRAIATNTVSDVGATTGDLVSAEKMAIASAPSVNRPAAGPLRKSIVAAVQLGRGRWSDARPWLDAAERAEPSQGLTSRAFLEGCGFLTVPAEQLRRDLAALEAWRRPVFPDSTSPGGYYFKIRRLHPAARAYLMGLLATRLGDLDGALARAKELEALPPPPADPFLPRILSAGLRARVSWQRGNAPEALRMLEASPTIGPIGPPSGWRSFVHERQLRAELLHAVGRDEEALRWYENLTVTEPFELPYLAPSYLRRAEIEEKLGRTAVALRHYRRFLELWKDCDPMFRREVERVREHVQRLSNATG